jgi:hypothetical protein
MINAGSSVSGVPKATTELKLACFNAEVISVSAFHASM